MVSALQNQRNAIFASVFPLSTQSHCPVSPLSTISPDTFPSSSQYQSTRSTTQYTRLAQHHVAWNTATRFLKLPDWNLSGPSSLAAIIGTATGTTNANARLRKHHVRPTADAENALRYLLEEEDAATAATEKTADYEPGTDSRSFSELLEWFTDEVRVHLDEHVRPVLAMWWQSEVMTPGCSWDALDATVDTLRQAQTFYFSHLDDFLLPVVRRYGSCDAAERMAARFTRDLHAMAVCALPRPQLERTLAAVLRDAGFRLFALGEEDVWQAGVHSAIEGGRAKHRVLALLRDLKSLGLGGDAAQRAAAQAMDSLMDAFIGGYYMKVDWFGRRSVTPILRRWIREEYSPFIAELMSSLTGEDYAVDLVEVQQRTSMAIGRLGMTRIANLFDYVVRWDQSLGAILDSKEYTASPGARVNLIQSFLEQITRRLLHAGATTTHILDIYIYVIRTFTKLDPKGILLERVAGPIRCYLRGRDDTARIIVSSLLADLESESSTNVDLSPDISAEIAEEMLNPVGPGIQDADHELNWADMNWNPDPVDASPEYRKTKSEDVLAFLLSLYDREDFVNELKNILGERLLRIDNLDFAKEIRLLELFKLRLGDSNLQACEVMLRDVLDSITINNQIHHELQQWSPAYRNSVIQLRSQILSSFFWPSLREDAFKLPEPIQQLIQEYEAAFEGIKDMRKLHWFPAIGRVAISLEFDDRSLDLEVLPWQATVIYAFQEATASASDVRPASAKAKRKTAVTKTVGELAEAIQLDETLLRSALTFWVGHRVLVEHDADTFAVIDSLTELDEEAEAAAIEAEEVCDQAAGAAVKSAEDVLDENMQTYRQFVVGMLTAHGRMRVDRIFDMLRKTVMGALPLGVEEVGEMLARMVDEGVLVHSADGFAIKR